MRKELLLSLGMFSAFASFAEVKTVTIPAVPKGVNCEFVVEDIPSNLGLSATADSIVRERLLNTTVVDNSKPSTPIQITATNEDGVTDTIYCVISTGKRGSLVVNDTTLCANDSVNALSLVKHEEGTYWWKNPISGDYEEKELDYDLSVQHFRLFPSDTMIFFKPDTLAMPLVYWEFNHSNLDTSAKIEATREPLIFTSPEQSYSYAFISEDTITGCWQTAISNITVNDCSLPKIIWENYYGPKDYKAWYGDDDYLKYLADDSIKARDPRVKCICPLPLDTIIETNRTRKSSECGYYNYDVTVKLAATIYDEFDESKPISDTIVAYVVHVSHSLEEISNVNQLIANYAGNCTFTVPEIHIPDADCDCPTYFNYYGITPKPGDTLTETTKAYMTFIGACGEEIVATTSIVVPDKDEIVKVTFNPDGAILLFYTDEKKSLLDLVTVEGKIRTIDWYTGEIIYVDNKSFVFDGSFAKAVDASSEDDFVYSPIDSLNQYLLDEVSKSGLYRIIATDTVTGCKDGDEVFIYVKDSTDSAPLYIADLTEKKGDIYTVSGSIVMQNVYLKDVMDRLKEGLYIFNNKKLYIKK